MIYQTERYVNESFAEVFPLDPDFIEMVMSMDAFCAQQELFIEKPRFGIAGGPDKVTLTEAGIKKILNFCTQGRWDVDSSQLWALQAVRANGGKIDASSVNERQDLALRELEKITISDRFQDSVAAALSGDTARYANIRNLNKLVYRELSGELDSSLGLSGASQWVLTDRGCEFLESFNRTAKALVKEHCSLKTRMEFSKSNSRSAYVIG